MNTNQKSLISLTRPSTFTDEEHKEWYSHVNAGNHNDIKIECYSMTAKRIIYSYEIISDCMGSHREFYIYDFDTHKSTLLSKDGCTRLRYHGNRNSFVSFYVYTTSKNVQHYIVLDSNFNNAPNLCGKKAYFDANLCLSCEVFGDCLLFVHNGFTYIIDGEYNVVAKFKQRLELTRNNYISTNTKHFIIKNADGDYAVYDASKDAIVLTSIRDVSEKDSYTDLELWNGDIYMYDCEKGEFVLWREHDSKLDEIFDTCGLCDELCSVDGKRISDTPHYIRDEVRIYRNDENNEYYILHGNAVVNQNCPFDNIRLIIDDDKVSYLCCIGNLQDIYTTNHKFKFDVFDMNGNNQADTLWFEKGKYSF